jgi:predicted 2-oxoglutarate/Fe(II)-dependent dioxygenase YbiX
MNLDIKSYFKEYENFFSDEVCDQTVKYLKDVSWYEHTYHNSRTGEFSSTQNELDVSWDTTPNYMELQNKLWDAIHDYVKEINVPWFESWNGYSGLRFNKYNVDTNMKLHCDHIHSLFDGERKGVPVLTILGVLNDDYEGGDLVLWEDTYMRPKKGSVLVFPSNFLYPHKVDTITKGTRYSFVSWAW